MQGCSSGMLSALVLSIGRRAHHGRDAGATPAPHSPGTRLGNAPEMPSWAMGSAPSPAATEVVLSLSETRALPQS